MRKSGGYFDSAGCARNMITINAKDKNINERALRENLAHIEKSIRWYYKDTYIYLEILMLFTGPKLTLI